MGLVTINILVSGFASLPAVRQHLERFHRSSWMRTTVAAAAADYRHTSTLDDWNRADMSRVNAME